jgi:alpha-D-xyloside xylohydrolase
MDCCNLSEYQDTLTGLPNRKGFSHELHILIDKDKMHQPVFCLLLQTAIDRVPMFVRAGSILPLGPEMQYVGEKKWDNLEVRIYPGADGQFMLYEDEGDNYNYEKGYYSTITFSWNDKACTLTIGTRQGGYEGMILDRKFNVVLPDGSSRQVEYNGNEISVKL